MGNRKKLPDDMDLFRREMGDVRPMEFEERVPVPARRGSERTGRQDRKPGSSRGDGKRTSDCPQSPHKQSFKTMDEANSAAEYVKQEWRREVRPYQCGYCGRFHLTSKSRG